MIKWFLYLGAAQGVGGDSAAPPALYCMYALCSSNSMYIVHLSAMSILNCPFLTKWKSPRQKLMQRLLKTPPGSHGGSRTALGVPRRAQGTPSKALPMRSLSKLKKGMELENACRDLRSLGTHFHIPYLSYV